MRRKYRKREVDQQLLETIFTLERKWKRIQSIVEKSIEPRPGNLHKESLARAKYLFLLREARHRKVSAIRYH